MLIAQQQKAEDLARKYVIVDKEVWTTICNSAEYEMESQVFDFDLLKQSGTFGMKNYSEAVYRGEL